MKRSTIFQPKLKDRKKRAKALGLTMRPQMPKIAELVFMPPSVDWDQEKDGSIMLEPTYRLKCASREMRTDGYDLTIAMRRSKPEILTVSASKWFKENVKIKDVQKLIEYYLDMLLIDTSFIYDQVKVNVEEFKTTWKKAIITAIKKA